MLNSSRSVNDMSTCGLERFQRLHVLLEAGIHTRCPLAPTQEPGFAEGAPYDEDAALGQKQAPPEQPP